MPSNPSAVLERVGRRSERGGAPRRYQSEQHRGRERKPRGEREHALVRKNVQGNRAPAHGKDSNEVIAHAIRQHHPKYRRLGRKQNALGQQLADEPGAAGANRHSNCHFVAPAVGTSEQQVRDVHTRRQQHQSADRKQHDQRFAVLLAHDCQSGARRLDTGRHALNWAIRSGSLTERAWVPPRPGETARSVQPCSSRLRPDRTRPTSWSQLYPASDVWLGTLRSRSDHKGTPKSTSRATISPRNQTRHSRDDKRTVIEFQRPADYRSVASETPLPISIAQHDNRCRAGAIVRWIDGAARTAGTPSIIKNPPVTYWPTLCSGGVFPTVTKKLD